MAVSKLRASQASTALVDRFALNCSLSCLIAFWLTLFCTPTICGEEADPAPKEEPAAFDAEAEAAAIASLKGWTSNLQKNRDGSVRFVRFSKPHVKDETVAHIAAFRRIDFLAVVTNSVGDAGLAKLETLTNLDTLCLSHSAITDATVEKVRHLNKLQRLYLDQTAVTDKGVESLREHPALEVLELTGPGVTGKSLQAIASIPQLRELSICDADVSNDDLKQLATLNKLKVLVIRNTRVTDLSVLSKCASLELIDASGCSIDPKNLLALGESKSLRQIIVRGGQLTEKAQQALRDANSRLALVVSPGPAEDKNSLQRYLAGEQLRGVEKQIPKLVSGESGKPIAPARERFSAGSETPSFQRHVVPLLGRLGCNGRTCHGSFQGKGGFRLSMFGYDFAADLESICGGEEPRINRKSPDESLILQKPTDEEFHGGGLRFKPDGWEHRLLRNWIVGGAKGQAKQAPTLVRLSVEPKEILFARDVRQKVALKCIAEWSDGAREDVTCLTRFQSNSDVVASVSKDGVVTSLGAGDTTVIAFYDSGVVSIPVMRPYAEPLRHDVENLPLGVDRFVSAKLAKLGVPTSPQCSDAEFLRRVSLDLIGTLPTPKEVREFLADKRPDKRARKIDALLETDAYVEWWTMRLADLTGSNSQGLGSTDMNSPASQQWNNWLRRRVRDNVGWDRIAAGIILADSRRPGQDYESYVREQSRHLARKQPTDFTDLEKPMHYYWFRSSNQTPSDRALAFSFIFMGVRLECAQCHKHPFDQWSKRDFEQFTQFFTRIKAGISPDAKAAQTHLKSKLGVPKKLDTAALRRQMYLRVSAEGLPIPWNEIWIQPPGPKPQIARLLGSSEFDLNDYADPREPLFDWLVSDDNPYFARAFVNRVWFRYFGRGIVDPPDDFNQANPPSHPAMLSWLAKGFAANKYDMKWLHRTILNSQTYQRSSQPNGLNRNDERNYSRSLIRRLPAEVAIDSILQATATDALAENWANNAARRKIAQHPRSFQARGVDFSLLVFGKPLRTTNCDCERQAQPTLLQSIYRRNDSDTVAWLERADGWLVAVAKQLREPLKRESQAAKEGAKTSPPTRADLSNEQQLELIESAYLRTLSRLPRDTERQRSLEHFAAAENNVEALRDLVWALLNTREFITNH